MSLNIEKINVSINQNSILKNVSLDIKDGEFVSLLGSSGCGKTTLLKSLAGILPISDGEIYLDGKAISKTPPEKRGAVIVFQDLRLFPHMTVEKNIAFAMELRGVPKAEQRRRITELLAAVQLPGFEKRRVKEMSGGQSQRVALARALAAEPKILLLDEPFSSLDESLREEMGQLVKELQEKLHLTTIMVTHDKEGAMKLSHRLALMDNGEILQYGTAEELFLQPRNRFVADYMGQANYIKGTVRQGVFHCPLADVPTDKPDGEYDLLVRPFAVRLTKGGDALVKRMYFKGEIVELEVLAAENVLKVQLPYGHWQQQQIKAEDRVQVEIDTDNILLFPTEEEEL